MSGWEWRGGGSGDGSGGAESRPATASDVPALHLSGKITPTVVRESAASWSLAGDRQLLHLLENIQQSILERSERVTTSLDVMTNSLDLASVALQNVNNRFSALGNTQFMECRVYDDDVTTDGAVEQSSLQDKQKVGGVMESGSAGELPGVSEVLGRYYDEVHIAPDSDSESDSGREDSVVLRARDLYVERPLPHIIGTPSWHNKWHVGLIEEDSDTDSSVCKREREEDQYSSCDSYEPSHPTFDSRLDKDAYSGETAMSEDSASHVTDVPQPAATPPPKPSPSDFAAELARRLGGDATAPIRSEHTRADQDERKARAVRTGRTFLNEAPQSRVTGNIFLDEPPPIDEVIESEPEDQSCEDDIFADLRNTNIFNRGTNANIFNRSTNTNVLNRNANSSQYGGLFDDLIPEDKDEKDIFDDFADANRNVLDKRERNDNRLFDDDLFADAGASNVKTAKSVIPTSLPKTGGLFDDDEEEDLFTDHVKPKPDNRDVASRETKTSPPVRPVIPENTASNSKKPVGGISLFRTNQGAENIGAAILKHHQRKTSVSSDDNDESFDDSSKVETRSSKTEDRSNMDSTDDDFDDLFAVKTKKPVNANAKFDDLFAKSIERNRSMEKENSIEDSTAEQKKADVKTDLREKSFTDNLFVKSHEHTKVLPKNKDDKKSLFEDDLFDSAKSLEKETVQKKSITKEKSIFSDDLFDDSNIFTSTMISNEKPVKTEVIKDLFGDDSDIFADVKTTQVSKTKQVKTKSLFDDDSDDDIFSNPVKPQIHKNSVDSKIDLKKYVGIESANNLGTLDTGNNTKENTIITNITKTLVKNTVIEELPPAINVFNKPKIETKVNIIEKPTESMENRRKISEAIESKSYGTIEKMHPTIIEKPELKGEDINTSTKENPSMVESDVFKDTATNLTVDKEAGQPIPKDGNVEPPNLIAENHVLDIKSSTSNKNNDENSNSKHSEKSSAIIGKPLLKEKPVIDKSNKDHVVKNHPVSTNSATVPESEINNKPPELPNMVTDIPVISRNTDKYESISHSENPGDDFFNTIFDDQPPVFQRSTEPKKSKNINALFDDDSDDEGLFLKKHDTMSITNSDDSKSVDDFIPPIEDRLFGIFHNDPPDFDVNFTMKREDSDDFDRNDRLESNFEEKDSVTIVKDIINNENVDFSKGDSDKTVTTLENTADTFFEDLEYVKIIRNEDGQKRREILSPNKSTSKPTESNNLDRKLGTEDLTNTSVVIQEQKEPKTTIRDENLQNETIKTVGKLKLPNLNINVQGLLPGAIPKKLTRPGISNEEIRKPDILKDKLNKPELIKDEFNVKKTEKMNVTNEDTSSKHDSLDGPVTGIAKSVSFDKGPESPTLVNAYSKERAKIQVKRRPSTRRARKDAIRKSAHNLVFENDTGVVDIADSCTVSLPTSPQNVTRSLESNLIDNVKNEDFDKVKTISQDVNTEKIITSVFASKNEGQAVKDTTNKTDIHKLLTESDNSDRNSDDNKSVFIKEKSIEPYSDGSSGEGTGVNTLGKAYSDRTTNVFDDDDAKLFASDASLSSVNVKVSKHLSKSSLDKTDDLFVSKIVIDPVEPNFERSQANTLFDSDESEIDELFKTNIIGTKTGASKTKSDIVNILVNTTNEDIPETSLTKKVDSVKKTSLFEDDIDDDVLFGTKTIHKLRETKISNVHEKSTASDDIFSKKSDLMKPSMQKKSLFGDDSDDDIFGTKKNVKAPAKAQPSQVKDLSQNAGTSAEEVFEDPLSHFD